MALPAVTRRTLMIGGGTGLGLIVAFLAWPTRQGSPLRPSSNEGVFGPYLRIATDGDVTLAMPQVETGQGISTGLAQIVADELGAAWENMAVEPAPLSPAFINSVFASEYELRTRITVLPEDVNPGGIHGRTKAAQARCGSGEPERQQQPTQRCAGGRNRQPGSPG